jgi:hypothetical protein
LVETSEPVMLPSIEGVGAKLVEEMRSKEKHILDTKAGKTTVFSCHRCLISSGIEKMSNI